MFFCRKQKQIETITIPLGEFNALKALVVSLQARIKELEEENRLLRNGRKSSTSSTPPSQDIGRSNSMSLRVKTGRSSGGQLGHQGHTLEIKTNPDKVIDHTPEFCTSCGEDLSGLPDEFVERKQEIVLPPIQAQYVEHRSYAKTCNHCGYKTVGAAPAHLHNQLQYGSSIDALIGYLSVYQYVPYRRIAELLRDVFGITMSEGSIDNILARMTRKSLHTYASIKEKIQTSKVVGGDETGVRIANKKGWLHTWQTSLLTFIAPSFRRDYNTITNLFSQGLPESVLVSDCWAAQIKTPAKQHQICIAHLLRELKNFQQALDCQWSIEVRDLLMEALELKKKLNPADYLYPNPAIQNIEKQMDILLKAECSDKHKKVQAFVKRLIKYRQYIFPFLYHPKVPPDNNASERAIRNAKVKMKISGQFKTEKGATRFSVLRSVVDTIKKNHQNIFDGLSIIATLA